MSHFVGTFEGTFLIGQAFININNIIPLKILIKRPSVYQWSNMTFNPRTISNGSRLRYFRTRDSTILLISIDHQSLLYFFGVYFPLFFTFAISIPIRIAESIDSIASELAGLPSNIRPS